MIPSCPDRHPEPRTQSFKDFFLFLDLLLFLGFCNAMLGDVIISLLIPFVYRLALESYQESGLLINYWNYDISKQKYSLRRQLIS